MKIKTVICLMACLLTIAALLPGCNSAQPVASAANSPQTASVAPVATSAAPVATPAETVQLVMERPLWTTADPSSPPYERIRQKIKEKLNIEVKVVGQQNPADQNEKANLMLAAGEPLDIFQTGCDPANYWLKYKLQDSIIPLNDLLDKYGQDLKANVDPSSWKMLTDADGKIWGLPDEQNAVTVTLMIRKDLLDKNSLNVPVTIADYENVLQTLKDKGNDEGFVGLFGDDSLDLVFAGSFMPYPGGLSTHFLDTDGKIKPTFVCPAYKNFLAKMAEWYQKGYIHKETFTLQYQQSCDIISAGRAALFLDWVNGNFNLDEDMIKKNVPEAHLIVLAPPKASVSPKVVAGATVSCNIMITKSSKHPEQAMQFLNWSQGTAEGWLLCQFGEEGTDWTWMDKGKNILQYTDKPVDTERYGYPIFNSCRLNKFNNMFGVGSTANNEVTTFLHDIAKYPSIFPPDAFTVYDLTKFKSKDLINSLNTYIKAEKAKIIMGQAAVSEWDNVIKKWLADGGQQLIDDYTEQYTASK